jgi:hypothetical protein
VKAAGGTANVVMGSAARAIVTQPDPEAAAPPVPVAYREVSPILAPVISPEPATTQQTQPTDVRTGVLNALTDAGQRMLCAMLETGEWQVDGNELLIKVSSSATVIEMSLGADARRLIIATAGGVLGKPVRLKVAPGGTVQQAPRNSGPSNGGGRGRAEQDPVVHRMKEKFGAEIRTIIDYTQKR